MTMKHLMMITALLLPVATGIAAPPTLKREIPTTSQFSREAFTNETAISWRAKLGVTAGGAATNAISDTNGIGVGLHEFDGVLATNYTGGGMGLTNIPESGVTGLPADLSSKTGTNETRAVIHTNAANTFRGTFYGDGSGLTGISGGGSASNVFFYPGNNITWSTVGGSNQANVTGTLSVDTAGTAGGLSAAVAQSLVTGLPADLSGKSGTNETRAIIHTNAANQFRGTFVGDGTAISGTLTNNTTGNAATATLSTNAVNATNLFGSITESQVTGLVTDLAGKVAVAPGNSIQTRTNSGAVIPELTGQTNVWNVMNYGAASYPANSTTAFNAAGTNLTFAGGTMWVPRAVYGITGTVALQGGLASGMPVAAFDYGNYTLRFDKHARVYCDVGTTNAFLFRTASGQWRKVQIEDGSLNGTNTTGALLPTQVGVAFDGPSGGLEVRRMNVQQMGVGYFVDDVTGANFDNIIGVGCNVGFAFGYKPDSVVVQNSTFRNNRWGAWTMFTNTQFTATSAIEGYPTFRNVTFGYNTNAGILHSHGELLIDDGCYFESNGPDTNSLTAVQIGMDTSDPYQQSFTNNSPSQGKPRVKVNNYSANWKHAFKVYHEKGAEIYFYGAKIVGSTAPVVRLMTAGADNSIIRSDVNDPLWITNSSGTWFSVPMGYMFVSNSIVPISGMASTNLTDSTNIARLNGTNVFTGNNTFASIVQVTNLVSPFELLTAASAATNYTIDFNAADKQSITATGNVAFLTINNISNGAMKRFYITNVFKATSNINVLMPTNCLVVTTNSGGPAALDTVGTNWVMTVTNDAKLSIECHGTTMRQLVWYLRLLQP